MEIGTANGGTLYLFSKIINKNGLIISTDMLHQEWKMNFYKSFTIDSKQIFLITGDSHKKRLSTLLKRYLKIKSWIYYL